VGLDSFYQQRVTVHATRSDPPTPRARAAAVLHSGGNRSRRRAKERKLRRWESLEQYDEEYRLLEQ
jgi:hypothetical protein